MKLSKPARARLFLPAVPLLGLLASCMQAEAPLPPERVDTRRLESQCGPSWDVQDVERYDGSLGVSQQWVADRQGAVGYHVGVGCSGTLISNDLFLSAGHCEYQVGHKVRFNYQNAPDGTRRPTQDHEVVEVVEQENGVGWDYAIVRLAGSPGLRFGSTPISAVDPAAGSLAVVIQHPAHVPKVIHAGPVLDYASAAGANWFRHQADTAEGSSGAGVLSADGLLVGVHTSAGCTTGARVVDGNSAMRMSRLVERSPTLKRLTSAEGRALVADFAGGSPPASVVYREDRGQSALLAGFLDDGDVQLAGDFLGRGRDQALFLNRSANGGRVLIADLSDGAAPAEVGYREDWGKSALLDGWHDAGDLQLVGDFTGRGYDQVMFINTAGTGGRVLIADFKGGAPPATRRYAESWGESTLLDGWHDAGDLQLVGDFMGRGYDQVMFINNGVGPGRVLIADFSDGAAPATAVYREDWGRSNLLDGWHDAGDLQLVGDFAGRGYDQVLFLNKGSGTKRVLVADFRDGAAPAEARYRELRGDHPLLDGWHDAGDLQLAGDFTGRGYDQVMFINTGGAPGHVLIADFRDGVPGAEVRYLESWAYSASLHGWHDARDVLRVGDFAARGYDQVLFLNRP
ncbi:trypsin-like serine peptidase [Sorangium sp. So ce131]|uniref:trypsin-like serine peptidase n=1 Tax=Sorangium sp. So ce131 TaxID=3133282 RepID=UPI003F611088